MFRKNKYWNKKVLIDWIKFDSKKEAKFYQELKILERAWNIKDLELQPKFILQEKFKNEWKTERAITYLADFMYFDNIKKKQVIVDVKGFKTEVYKIKRKLFLYKFRKEEFEFLEIN